MIFLPSHPFYILLSAAFKFTFFPNHYYMHICDVHLKDELKIILLPIHGNLWSWKTHLYHQNGSSGLMNHYERKHAKQVCYFLCHVCTSGGSYRLTPASFYDSDF